MKLSKITAVALALLAGTAAQATTLTFDDLNDQYGDGSSIGANMTSDGSTLAYSESGYLLTLHTFGGSAHIGDATYVSGTFNWHDSGDNLDGAFVTLTKVGGGTFNLKLFDFVNYGSGLSIDGTFLGNGPGNFVADYHNVTSVSFTSNNYSDNGLDNIAVGGVPEPATWALMIGGFGLTGFAMRRRSAAVAA